MFCTNCGGELEPGAKFCIHCGAPVEEDNNVESPTVNVFPNESAPAAAPSQPQQPWSPETTVVPESQEAWPPVPPQPVNTTDQQQYYNAGNQQFDTIGNQPFDTVPQVQPVYAPYPDPSAGAPRRRRHVVPIVIGCLAVVAVAAGVTIFVIKPEGIWPGSSEPAGAAATTVEAGLVATTQAEPATLAATATTAAAPVDSTSAASLKAKLNLTEDIRPVLSHGSKPVEDQRYIVLHDVDEESELRFGTDPESIVTRWASTDKHVAAHFVIGRNGDIVQCVPLDEIAHHAGYGDTGNNAKFGVTDESRDDMQGVEPIGAPYTDFGMNSYSIGIELVHVPGEGGYPDAQLDALDGLIAYVDAYFAEEGLTQPSQIISHPEWASYAPEKASEFSAYLNNYKNHRTHL